MSFWPPDGVFRVYPPQTYAIPVQAGIGLHLPDGAVVNNGTNGPQYGFVNKVTTGINATNTTVWTPSAATLRWALLGFYISFSGNISRAAASTVAITLQDTSGGTAVGGGQIFIPNAAGTVLGGPQIGPVNLPFAVSAAAVNTILNLNIPTGLSTGTATVHVWGYEST